MLSIVGGFLLANSIVFRHPRRLVEEHLAAARASCSRSGEYIFHRVQVHLGFWILLAGFALQLYGHLRPIEPPEGGGLLLVGVIGGILAGVVALEIAGLVVVAPPVPSLRARVLPDPSARLESDVKLARELADLYGIAATGEDTVEAFSARLRREMGLVHLARVNVPRPARVDDLSTVDETEAEEIEEELV